MKKLLFILTFAASLVTASAQNITRVTTLWCSSLQTNAQGAQFYGNATNQITIPAGEAARISTQKFWTEGNEANFAFTGWVQRGIWFDAEDGDVVEGPVTFVIEVTAISDTYCRLTLERWKVAKK